MEVPAAKHCTSALANAAVTGEVNKIVPAGPLFVETVKVRPSALRMSVTPPAPVIWIESRGVPVTDKKGWMIA